MKKMRDRKRQRRGEVDARAKSNAMPGATEETSARTKITARTETSLRPETSTRGEMSTNAIKDFPIGWLILWFLLALSLLIPPVSKAQESLVASSFNASSPLLASASDVRSAATVEAVESIGITVSDMERSVQFYSEVLSFEKVSDMEVAGTDYEYLQGIFGLRMRVVRMRLGDEQIELTEYLTPKGKPLQVDSRSNDRWFQHIAIITSDMDKAYARLRRYRVEHASTAPQTLPAWNKSAGGIRAFYFRDPDRHWLEVLQFPQGKGDAKWQQSKGKLFLGIDHTAIVVGNTDASLQFYRDLLGMRIAGESENYGTEQEHLNNVFGARLRITSMRASRGPGIEFLEYLSPRDGRPLPSDQRANDLAHWQTRLAVRDANRAAQILAGEPYAFISTGVVDLSEAALGFSKALLVRDPDGHAMQLVEK